jgi:hypothetical protein
MKPYKFLIPVGIAASALAGNGAKASLTTSPEAKTEHLADHLLSASVQGFAQKYIVDGEEHTLLMKLSDQGVLYAQHESHSSHASHESHASHQSHRSGS